MNLSERDIELIDGFIRGELNQEMEDEFNNRMNDPVFKEELYYRQDLVKATIAVQRENRKSILQNEEAMIRKGSSEGIFNKWKWPLIIILILISSFLAYSVLKDEPVDSSTLFAEYFEPFPNVVNPILMSTDQETLDPFQLYEQKRYTEAISAFNLKDERNESDEFYHALSYLYLDDIESAKTILTRTSNNDTHRFHQASEWYLAGIFVKENRISEATNLLEKIKTEDTHPYRINAEELLDFIK